jgi:hypothetical protein
MVFNQFLDALKRLKRSLFLCDLVKPSLKFGSILVYKGGDCFPGVCGCLVWDTRLSALPFIALRVRVP